MGTKESNILQPPKETEGSFPDVTNGPDEPLNEE